jgi:hypothetical protein
MLIKLSTKQTLGQRRVHWNQYIARALIYFELYAINETVSYQFLIEFD